MPYDVDLNGVAMIKAILGKLAHATGLTMINMKIFVSNVQIGSKTASNITFSCLSR